MHVVSYVNDIFLDDSTAYYDPGSSWIEFNNNKTGQIWIIDSQDDEFTWSVTGDVITIKFTTGAESTRNITFSISETQLTWYSTMNQGAYIKNPSKTYKEVWYLWAKKI